MINLILDNIIFSLQKAGGISSIWNELVKQVNCSSNFNSFFIEYPNATDNLYRKEVIINKKKIIEKIANPKINHFFNPYLKFDEPFIFHSSYYRISKNKNAKNVTTVHDFIHEYTRKGMPKYFHHLKKKRAIYSSDAIICISQNTKKDLLRFFPKVDEKIISVIHNGISKEFDIRNKKSEELILQYGNYVLFVGARHVPHKNFTPVVDALENHRNLNLVIIGGNSLDDNEIAFMNKKIKNRYFHISGVSNQKLNELYNDAFALIYPSLYEGFGIPIIEAQASGCPVIATNASSVTEIATGSALLIEKGTSEEISTELNKLYNFEFRKSIIDLGYNNSKRFTMEKMISEILKVYKSLSS
jgi:mannosyltransferase